MSDLPEIGVRGLRRRKGGCKKIASKYISVRFWGYQVFSREPKNRCMFDQIWVRTANNHLTSRGVQLLTLEIMYTVMWRNVLSWVVICSRIIYDAASPSRQWLACKPIGALHCV